MKEIFNILVSVGFACAGGYLAGIPGAILGCLVATVFLTSVGLESW